MHGFECCLLRIPRRCRRRAPRLPIRRRRLLVEEARHACTLGDAVAASIAGSDSRWSSARSLELEDVVAAEVLGVSRDNFRQRLSRARRELQLVSGESLRTRRSREPLVDAQKRWLDGDPSGFLEISGRRRRLFSTRSSSDASTSGWARAYYESLRGTIRARALRNLEPGSYNTLATPRSSPSNFSSWDGTERQCAGTARRSTGSAELDG